MKLTGMQILNLGSVIAEVRTQPIYIKAGLSFRRFGKKLAEEGKTIEEERTELANTLCKKDENGELVIENNSYTFETPELEAQFTADVGVLFAEEVEIEFEPMKATALGPNVMLSTVVLEYLIDNGILLED